MMQTTSVRRIVCAATTTVAPKTAAPKRTLKALNLTKSNLVNSQGGRYTKVGEAWRLDGWLLMGCRPGDGGRRHRCFHCHRCGGGSCSPGGAFLVPLTWHRQRSPRLARRSPSHSQPPRVPPLPPIHPPTHLPHPRHHPTLPPTHPIAPSPTHHIPPPSSAAAPLQNMDGVIYEMVYNSADDSITVIERKNQIQYPVVVGELAPPPGTLAAARSLGQMPVCSTPAYLVGREGEIGHVAGGMHAGEKEWGIETGRPATTHWENGYVGRQLQSRAPRAAPGADHRRHGQEAALITFSSSLAHGCTLIMGAVKGCH